jgi:hypothetical protein
VYGCVINHYHRRSLQPLAGKGEAVGNGLGLQSACKGKSLKVVPQVGKAQDVLAGARGGSQRKGRTDFLPGRGYTRGEREARFVGIPELPLTGRIRRVSPERGQFSGRGAGRRLRPPGPPAAARAFPSIVGRPGVSAGGGPD